MTFPGSHSRKGANPGLPDSGAHALNIDVEDMTTGFTISLQSLIHDLEIQKVLKTEKKNFLTHLATKFDLNCHETNYRL